MRRSALVASLIWLISIVEAYSSTKRLNSPQFETLRRAGKDPWLAVFLTQFIPGLGHLYLGKWLIGIGLLLLFFVVVALLPNLVQGLSGILIAAIAYYAYISTPNRREYSKRLILLTCGLIAFFAIVTPNALFIRQNVAEARYIPSRAMIPTLQVDDRVLVDKLRYRSQTPQRDDVIVFIATDEASVVCGGNSSNNLSNTAFIKRIVGLPGEKLEVKQGKVYINDRPLQENYIQEPAEYQFGPKVIPQQAYFVLGDNRNNSCDSHYWGFVPRENIIGRASKIFWPLDRARSLTKP